MQSAGSEDLSNQFSEQATIQESSNLMPAFFISHGGPNLVLEKNQYTVFLKSLPTTYPKPRAIVIFSAHYEETTQSIGRVEKNSTYYDFYGFPKEMYQIKYEAPGYTELSDDIQQLLKENGIKSKFDNKRGLDHGSWCPLEIIYPSKDIPVIPMSVNSDLNPEEIYKIGKALAPLREKGVLIIGSGQTLHNLRKVDWSNGAPQQWAVDFEDWINQKVVDWDTSELFDYMKKAPNAKVAVPTPEHFIPLIYAMGTGDGNRKASVVHKWMQFGSMNLTVLRFD